MTSSLQKQADLFLFTSVQDVKEVSHLFLQDIYIYICMFHW